MKHQISFHFLIRRLWSNKLLHSRKLSSFQLDPLTMSSFSFLSYTHCLLFIVIITFMQAKALLNSDEVIMFWTMIIQSIARHFLPEDLLSLVMHLWWFSFVCNFRRRCFLFLIAYVLRNQCEKKPRLTFFGILPSHWREEDNKNL